MLQIKLLLTLASAGLVYYGSEYLYHFFSTPAPPVNAHGDIAAAAPSVLPGAAALIVGLILAFVCIFLWTSAIGQPKPRRYAPMPAYVEPAYTPPTPQRTLADMPIAAMPGTVRPMPRMAGDVPNSGQRRRHSVASAQVTATEETSRTPSAKVPPPFDPYGDDAGNASAA